MPHGRNEKGVCCHRLGQREGSFFLNVLFPRSWWALLTTFLPPSFGLLDPPTPNLFVEASHSFQLLRLRPAPLSCPTTHRRQIPRLPYVFLSSLAVFCLRRRQLPPHPISLLTLSLDFCTVKNPWAIPSIVSVLRDYRSGLWRRPRLQ